MNSIFISITIFTLVSLVAVLVARIIDQSLFKYRRAIGACLTDLDRRNAGQSTLAAFSDISEQRERGWLSFSTSTRWLQDTLDRANITCTARQFLTASVCLSIVLGGVGYLVSSFQILPFAMIGFLAPLFAVIAKRNNRSRRLAEQLPEVFRLISRAIRSGQTVTAAMKMVADDFPDPISIAFAQCYEQQDRGISRESAFRRMADHSGVLELKIFVVALLVQNKSGGDLVAVLENMSGMVEKRLRLKNRMRAMTAEGRMQAIVLMVLPAIAFGAVFLFSPDYASILIDHPKLLVATVAIQAVGAIWIHRIINFEY